MGLYDSVWVHCTNCGERIEFQSKAGECILAQYTLDETPCGILIDIDGDYTFCPQCESVVSIEVYSKLVGIMRCSGGKSDNN